jgi:antitoxin VapB
MGKSATAKLFRNGRSQAVRLPREFRFEGDRVRVRRVSDGVLLERMISDPREWFAELDRQKSGTFMPEGAPGRRQPRAPKREIFD